MSGVRNRDACMTGYRQSGVLPKRYVPFSASLHEPGLAKWTGYPVKWSRGAQYRACRIHTSNTREPAVVTPGVTITSPAYSLSGWNSHRLTPYKIVGHLFRRSYLTLVPEESGRKYFITIINISDPCPHAQLRGRTIIKNLWTFSDLRGSRLLSVTAMLKNVYFSGSNEYINPQPRRGRHG